VELAGLVDPALLSQSIAAALGIREQPGRPLAETLVDALRHRALLLVLDNCEHLVMASAQLADALLRSCPALRVLATSRESLGVAGEVSWRVPSLELPQYQGDASPADLARSEAVRLFVERARAALPGFALSAEAGATVAEICQRLDGIPLAIELAAAQVRILTPHGIAERLDDCFQLLTRGSRTAPLRQQTLRATVEWSYALLSDAERQLFDRLSSFVGGCTLDAAESVCAATAREASSVLHRMGSLVEKSLVLAEPGPDGTMRYRLLEPLRQYGHERLELAHDADAVHARHATFFLTLAQRAAPALVGPHGPAYRAWLDRLEQDHDNLRVALRWLIAQRQVALAERLGGALRYFWLFQGYLSEGRAWLAELAALPAGPSPSAGRAQVLSGTVMLAVVQGDYAAASESAREAEGLWRTLENPWEHAIALLNLGTIAAAGGDRLDARSHFEEAIRISRAAGDRTAEALNLHGLAELAFSAGDYANATARSCAEQALALSQAMGWASPRNTPQILGLLGDVRLEEGDLAAARAAFEESLVRARDIGWAWGVALALVRVGHVATEQGHLPRAHEVFVEALAIHRAQGNAPGIVSALAGFAHLAARSGHQGRALRLAGAVRTSQKTLYLPSNPAVVDRLERWIATSSWAPGEGAAIELAQGQKLSLDEAIRYALEPIEPHPDEAAPPRSALPLRQGTSGLTPREEAVAALVADGLTNRQIAETLVISERTVESHVRHALGKLDLPSRVGLATWALEHGIRSPRSR
jgi:non-specific serine/threonine protein kinase